MSNEFNIEIKARCNDLDKIRSILKTKNALFKGVDNQVDTYFNSKIGRLKLREGNIESNLIFYDRIEDEKESKESEIILFKNIDDDLKKILIKSNGIKVIVDKKREIHFINNIKFHIDVVKNLGEFIEIECIKKDNLTKEDLVKQLEEYKSKLSIKEVDLISESYSDLLLK
jgi:predicted adenylyl cyclase CyaB